MHIYRCRKPVPYTLHGQGPRPRPGPGPGPGLLGGGHVRCLDKLIILLVDVGHCVTLPGNSTLEFIEKQNGMPAKFQIPRYPVWLQCIPKLMRGSIDADFDALGHHLWNLAVSSMILASIWYDL